MKNLARVLILVLTIIICTVTVFADTLEDEIFHSTYTTLDSSKVVTFYARTKITQPSIYVSSCYLYKKNGNVWNPDHSLPVPPDVATNTITFGATMDYSSYIGTGTYRVRVTYCSNGHSVSKYSNSVTY